MILGTGKAPGKVILFGEHAVVYGRPALAVPVTQVHAEAWVHERAGSAPFLIEAPDLGEAVTLNEARPDHPLAAATRLGLQHLNITRLPPWRLTVRSSIPIASGMGSGAAVTVAILRALAAATGAGLEPAVASALAYEVERLYHGTPSGIDNSVVAFGQPVRFSRALGPQPFAIGKPFSLAIADSGIASPTRIAVADVRRAWQAEPERFEALFDRIGNIVDIASAAIFAGRPEQLGLLMQQNHILLREIGVSCPKLDDLVRVAMAAGAMGAKLSGAGQGGNAIALVDAGSAGPVTAALEAAGAKAVIVTYVSDRRES